MFRQSVLRRVWPDKVILVGQARQRLTRFSSTLSVCARHFVHARLWNNCWPSLVDNSESAEPSGVLFKGSNSACSGPRSGFSALVLQDFPAQRCLNFLVCQTRVQVFQAQRRLPPRTRPMDVSARPVRLSAAAGFCECHFRPQPISFRAPTSLSHPDFPTWPIQGRQFLPRSRDLGPQSRHWTAVQGTGRAQVSPSSTHYRLAVSRW